MNICINGSYPVPLHAAVAQQRPSRQAQLQSVPAKAIGAGLIAARLRPSLQELTRRAGGPLGPWRQIYNLFSLLFAILFATLIHGLFAMPSAPSAVQLLALPSLSDNYIWLLHDGRQAVVCDPGEAQPVATALHDLGLELAAIFITHHHADHTGGLLDLYRQCGSDNTRVYLPAADGLADELFSSIPAQALHRCQEGDKADDKESNSVQALGLKFQVLDVPGHTAGHIAFYAPAQPGLDAPVLLCGDTLFSAGCGRLFEGTPAQMWASLQKLAALPDNTRVCCAHEYTVANLRFAQAVEPDNAAIEQHARQCQALRAQNLPTVPTSLLQEKAINPFLRVHEPVVQAAVAAHTPSCHACAASPLETFTALRAWKDRF